MKASRIPFSGGNLCIYLIDSIEIDDWNAIPILLMTIVYMISLNTEGIFHEKKTDMNKKNKLKADLNAVYNWAVMNNMMFNLDKFELLHYKSKASKQMQSETPHVSNDGSIIPQKEQVRQNLLALPYKSSYILDIFRTGASSYGTTYI